MALSNRRLRRVPLYWGGTRSPVQQVIAPTPAPAPSNTIDTLPWVGLWGERRLRPSFGDGAVVRVRRTSDQAETDLSVSGTASNKIDYAAARTWASGNSAKAVRLYNQGTISGAHLTQYDAQAQPALNLNGEVFENIDTATPTRPLGWENTTWTTPSEVTMVAYARRRDTRTDQVIIANRVDSQICGVRFDATGYLTVTLDGYSELSVACSDYAWHCIIAVCRADGSCTLYVDGTAYSGAVGAYGMDTIRVGFDDDGYHLNGNIKAVGVIDRALTASEAAAVNSYWTSELAVNPILEIQQTKLVGVYAFRKIVPSFAGDFGVARDEADNNEYTIGWASSGLWDVSGLTTWLGGGAARLKTLYNQGFGLTGSVALNLTNATHANRPGIDTASGYLNHDDGTNRRYLAYDPAAAFVDSGGTSMTDYAVLALAQRRSALTNNGRVVHVRSGTTQSGLGFSTGGETVDFTAYTTANGAASKVVTGVNSRWAVLHGDKSGTAVEVGVDELAANIGTGTLTTGYTINRMSLGAINDSATNPFRGWTKAAILISGSVAQQERLNIAKWMRDNL